MGVALEEATCEVDYDFFEQSIDEEDMAPGAREPTNKDQLREIIESIQVLKHQQPRWLSYASFVAAMLAIPIALGAWWQPQQRQASDAASDLHVNSLVDGKLREHGFETLVKDVAELNGKVETILAYQRSVIGRQIKHDAALPQSEFQQNISSLATAFDAAREARMMLDPPTLTAVQEKLAATPPQNPAFLSLAAAVVNYRFQKSGVDREEELPNCFDNFKGHAELLPHSPNSRSTHQQFFAGCRLVIDDVPGYLQSGFGQALLHFGDPSGKMLYFHLQDGVVVYSGGSLIPFETLECNRCRFRVRASPQSPPAGQQMVRYLFATNEEHVALRGPKYGG